MATVPLGGAGPVSLTRGYPPVWALAHRGKGALRPGSVEAEVFAGPRVAYRCNMAGQCCYHSAGSDHPDKLKAVDEIYVSSAINRQALASE